MESAEVEKILTHASYVPVVEDATPPEEPPPTTADNNNNNVDNNVDKERREMLVRLAEDGEIDKTVAYIKKASKKVIDKIYDEYERKRTKKANEFITDALISKFAEALGGLNAIESSEELTEELRRDELLRKDVCYVVEILSPYIPFIGLLSGSVTTAKHICKHREDKEA